MKRFLLLFFIASISFSFSSKAEKWRSTVAVVVDQTTYSKIAQEINLYLNAIEEEGKKTVLIVDRWQHPDSIRLELKRHYQKENLEGVILVGDIPVAMIRDAQHLTTAFKMDQERDWKRSSVPSDRFYDDFDLLFDYIKQDQDVALYHYYSLRGDSPQRIACDIYSSRIKAPAIPGISKYEAIGTFLTKAAIQKKTTARMNRILHFVGHGYNSESFSAKIDENYALKEHFPFLRKRPGSQLHFINFDTDPFVKERLLGSLAEKNLDLAILHHHGSDDAQLLNDNPKTSMAGQYIEYAKIFFRNKIRNSRDTAKTKEYYLENYDITESWLEGWNDPQITEKDSTFYASMDINIPDLYEFKAGAKVIILDACFNGSFHLDDYIAGYYPFNKDSRTLVVRANSVNTLQDIWSDELIGLLDAGVCVGNWAKGQMTLETHLIGDATYSFSNNYPQTNLDRDMVKQKNNPKFWKSFLKSTEPEFRALAIKMLTGMHAIKAEELLEVERTDQSPVVRLEAFISLIRHSDQYVPEAIRYGMTDSYELLQRLATLYAAKNGSPTLIETLARTYLSPTTSTRVNFQVQFAARQYSAQAFIDYMEQLRTGNPYYPTEDRFAKIKKSLENNYESDKKEFYALPDTTVNRKNKVFTIKAQRNLCQSQYLEQLFDFFEETDDRELRLLITETLGWYVHSYRKEYIIQECVRMAANEKDPVVKLELKKTLNRLNKNP